MAAAVVAPGVGGEAGSAVSLALALPLGQSARTFEALGGAAPRVLSFGSDFDIGAISHGEGVKLVMRLDRIAIPWPMVVVSLAWAVVLGLALRGALADDRRALMLFGALQLLLALRWLIALDGAHLDFGADWPGLMRESALAYVAAPALLAIGYAALRPAARGDRPRRARLGSVAGAIALFVAAMLGAFTPPADLATAAREAALPVICIAAALASIVAGGGRGHHRPRLQPAAAAKPGPLQWLSGQPTVCAAFVLADVAGAGRRRARRDSRSASAGIPISLVYLPLALTGIAAFI